VNSEVVNFDQTGVLWAAYFEIVDRLLVRNRPQFAAMSRGGSVA